MALVIDSSSPAQATSVTDTVVGSAFTPPADPLLLALWAGNSAATGVTAPTVSSSPAQTWTMDDREDYDSGGAGLPGQAAFCHAQPAGAPGSTTVTVVNHAVTQVSAILKCYVLTGHDPVAPIGVHGSNRQNGGSTITETFVASITGGQGFMVISDWNAGATSGWAAASGCTIINKGTLLDAGSFPVLSYAVVQRTDPDEIVGASTSLGVTGLPSGGQYHWAYAEVISLEAALAAAAAGYPSFGANAPMF